MKTAKVFHHERFALYGIFPMEYNICIDKLPAAVTVHFP